MRATGVSKSMPAVSFIVFSSSVSFDTWTRRASIRCLGVARFGGQTDPRDGDLALVRDRPDTGDALDEAVSDPDDVSSLTIARVAGAFVAVSFKVPGRRTGMMTASSGSALACHSSNPAGRRSSSPSHSSSSQSRLGPSSVASHSSPEGGASVPAIDGEDGTKLLMLTLLNKT